MDETLKLIKLSQSGDKDAKRELIEKNSGLVWSIVRKFMGRGYEADDLFQIGSIGLLKCIDKFDLSYDVKFSTYAVPMIMGEIKRFLRDDGMIKVSRSLKEIAIKARYTSEAMAQKTGVSPTMSELAAALEVDVNELCLAMEANMDVESLYATIYQGDGNPIYLLDKLTHEESGEASLVDSIALKEAINNLNPKERQIIMMRYFDDKTQTEVANVIGISQVQVSRIERRVLKTIRDNLG